MPILASWPLRLVALGAAAYTTAAAQASPSTLAERIQSVTDRPEFRHAIFGIEFYDLDSGRIVYALNADKLFTAASTTKLVTEGTALELLGADFRFHTRVYRTGPVDSDGTLRGDLVLVASGDPNLSSRVRSDGTLAFENHDHAYGGDPDTRAVPGDPLLIIHDLARQVAARGVKRIRGRVLVDASLFPEGERELGTGVVISPVVVNDNIVDVMVAPGPTTGAPATLKPAPLTSYVRFVNRATTGAADSQPRIEWSTDSTGPDGSHIVMVTGSVPVGKPGTLFPYAVPEPSRFAEVVFVEALRAAGVQVALRSPARHPEFAALAPAYTADRLLAEHVSPVLAEEVRVTLKVSQNLHASMTPELLGALLAPQDTMRTGFDVEREFLERAGLDLGGASQGDGAGGDAHFSPAFMVSFLAYLARQPDSAVFRGALPILGHDGTLWKIQPQSPAAGHVFAKTGTYVVGDPLRRGWMLTAKGLAGYMTTRDGRHLAFAVYVNNVSLPTMDAITPIVGQALGEIAAAAYEAAR